MPATTYRPYAAWHVHRWPNGEVGYEWALDREGNEMPFGSQVGPQPFTGIEHNGCSCLECAARRNEGA